MHRILVVDDNATLAEQYAYDLGRIGGYAAQVATGGTEAIERATGEAFDCIILDLEMPGADGFAVLAELRRRHVAVPVIVYTGTGNYDRCVKAMRLGASGFIDKSESMERVTHEVDNAMERVRLEREVRVLRGDLGRDTPLVGSSESMRELGAAIARVAPVPSGVLITGESGTGKELVARELHRLGAGARRPFVAVNSAALPDTLIESELFGHERGAFTGANRLHRGAFERADGGTLFLDEIGELPASAQARLLRVLETHCVTRVGGESELEINARVVAATHRDLDTEVQAGRFREDLYYRLNVHVIRVPPLRERRGDIAELAGHFVRDICTRFGLREKRYAPDALTALESYDWARNNVRELRNIIERMVIASPGDEIGVVAVPVEIRRAVTGVGAAGARALRAGECPPRGRAVPDGAPVQKTFHELRADAEREIIRVTLARHNGSVSQTARALGLADHASLLKIMRRLGMARS